MAAKKIPSTIPRGHAVVIGGGRGIGEAIVRRLASGGWSVTIADRLAAETESLCKALRKQKHDVFAEAVDISNPNDLRRLGTTLKKRAGSRGITAAVNSVGIFNIRGGLMETSLEEFERLQRINLTGAFSFSKIVVPLMAKNGSLVHIGSVNGKIAGGDLGAYKVSKAGLHMMSKCLALELAPQPKHIRVNVVAPGWVDTPGERMVMKQEGRTGVLDDPESANIIPMQRRTEGREIADAVAFLCSEQGSAITGQVLYVDCGITATFPS
jgi:NAD(P)-dependent dehydrogenase (short-subunit alcohol dehydrogenase family)